MKSNQLFQVMTDEEQKEYIKSGKNDTERLTAVIDGNKYKYLLLIEGEVYGNEGENYRTFEFVDGRQAAYDFIRDLLLMPVEEAGYILDVKKSKIIAQPPADIIESTPRITFDNMLSFYGFMTSVRNRHLVEDDSFNIEDYCDYEEE